MRENTREELWDEVRSLREENETLWVELREATNTLDDIVQDALDTKEDIKATAKDLGGELEKDFKWRAETMDKVLKVSENEVLDLSQVEDIERNEKAGYLIFRMRSGAAYSMKDIKGYGSIVNRWARIIEEEEKWTTKK